MSLAKFRTLYRNRWKYHPGYLWAFLAEDGEILCYQCVKENLRSIIDSIALNLRDGWAVATIVNVSDMEGRIDCCNCNKTLREDDSET